MVQLALNNNALETTKESPFFLNYGKPPNLFMEPRTLVKAEKAIVIVEELQKAHATTREAIRHSQQSKQARKQVKNKQARKQANKKATKTARRRNKTTKTHTTKKNEN